MWRERIWLPYIPDTSLDAIDATTSVCLCAATVDSSPGTLVEVWLTYLQPELLLRMHATEGAYDLLQLQDVHLHVGSSLPAYRCSLCL